MAAVVDVIEWGSTYELDILIQDVAVDGTLTPTDLSPYTVQDTVVRLTNESGAIICTPVLSQPAAGTIRFHLSPAMTKLMPRTAAGVSLPTVVSEVRITTANGEDAFRPVKMSFTIDVGPLQS